MLVSAHSCRNGRVYKKSRENNCFVMSHFRYSSITFLFSLVISFICTHRWYCSVHYVSWLTACSQGIYQSAGCERQGQEGGKRFVMKKSSRGYLSKQCGNSTAFPSKVRSRKRLRRGELQRKDNRKKVMVVREKLWA